MNSFDKLFIVIKLSQSISLKLKSPNKTNRSDADFVKQLMKIYICAWLSAELLELPQT